MADKVRVGVVGTSWWADLMFLPILTKYELCTVTALCGRNRERADEVAAKFAVPQVYTDYRQMIEKGNLDAVFVLTSDESHYEMTMAALDAGFHGSVRFITGFGRGSEYAWRFDADLCNGVAADLGSHAIHLAQWLLGDVTAVSAQLGFHVPHEGYEGKPLNKANDMALMTLELTNGAGAQIAVSSVAHSGIGEKNDILLYGERGSIEAGWGLKDIPTLFHFLHASQEGSDGVLRDDHEMDFLNYFQTQAIGPRQFIDGIVNDKPTYPSFREGYKIQQVIDAALESHRTGCRVAISS